MAQIRTWHHPNTSVRVSRLKQPEVNYCIYKLSPPEPTLSHFHLYYIINNSFFKIHFNIIRVKCTLVQAPRLCTGRTIHRGNRGLALLFHDHGTTRERRVSVTPRTLFTSGKDPKPIVQKAGWAPGPVWTGTENLAPTGIRSQDRPARSQSLYRLRYPVHL
jgi:hypothetical protein